MARHLEFVHHPLKGYFEKNILIFYINQNDASDIKLPYELITSKNIYKSEKDLLFEIDTSDYDQYMIRYDRDPNSSISKKCFGLSYGNFHDDNSYKFMKKEKSLLELMRNYTYNYNVDVDHIGNVKRDSRFALIKFIKNNQLTSDELVNYYIHLVELKQPTDNELINKLIYFEKYKKEHLRLHDVNSQEKVLNLIDNYQKDH